MANFALNFDGSNDYVKTSAFSIPNTNGTLTISVGVKRLSDIGHLQGIVDTKNPGSTNGFIRFDADGSYFGYAYYDGTGYNSNWLAYPSGFDNQGLHIVVVCDYSNKKIYFYRNGTLVSSQDMKGSPIFPGLNESIYIGSFGYSPYSGYGSLDDVRIYNRALSADEIQALYSSSVGKYK